MNDVIGLTKKINRLKIFASSVLIGHPLPLFARVIQVKHRGYRIYTQAIDMIALAPSKCTCNKETPDFVTSIVKNQSAPILVETLTRIGVLVERCIVKASERKTIGRKVSRYPVHNHPNAVLMKRIDEEHEVLRHPETISWRKVSCHLITPRAIEGMLG